MSEVAWDEALRRSTVIGALADSGEVPGWAAGEELGLSRRRVYQLVRRHRCGPLLLTSVNQCSRLLKMTETIFCAVT